MFIIGVSCPELNKTVYPGIRELLDWKHPTRFQGQSRNCCPKGFYDYQIYSATETYPFLSATDRANKTSPRTLNINNYNQLPCFKQMKTLKKK